MLKLFTLFLIISTVAIKSSASDDKDYTTVSNDIETTLYPDDQNDDEDYLRAIAFDPLSPQTNDSRINGGITVQQIVPYQVSLQSYRRNSWFHFCGGSIISPNHVLTAAHCVHQMQAHEIHVVAGTLTWKRGGDRHRVLSKRQHPQFAMSPKIIYDVAILKVSPPFNLHKSTVGTISLGSANRVGEKVSVQLTGWGATTPTPAGGVAENLQQLNYQTLSNAECARKGFRVTNGEICALDGRGRGSCVGDSGGPLVTTQKPAQLVGIVSYGTVPCAQGRPDVYSRVSTLLPYINRVVSSEMP